MVASVLIFLIVLSVLVLVHELGHFIMARRAGIWVEEFGFGLPPRILGKKIGETIYSINLFPFGGFVRLHGETSDTEVKNPQRAFLNKDRRTRVTVILAGVVMNFILAITAFSLFYSFSGIPKKTDKIKVIGVTAGSPAQIAGILVGDTVRKVEGEEISSSEKFIEIIEKRKGQKTKIELEKVEDGKVVVQTLVPRENPPVNEGPLGVVITSMEIYYPPIWQRPFVGIYFGFQEAVFWGKTVIVGLMMMIAELFTGKVPKDVAGPIGIFAITSEVAKTGILSLINFVGILSVNLAILNIIPFPALDGGRLLFIAIEKFFGRRVMPKIEAVVHTIGMVILLFLIMAITARDIQRLIAAGSISGFLESVLK